MKARHLIPLILLALLAFGGTFTCKSSTDGHHHTENPSTPAK